MIYPKYLNKNDYIGVCALSDGFSENKYTKLNLAINNVELLGYKLHIDNIAKSSIKGRSADKVIRANNFINMYKDKNIKCLINARGGDFLFETLPYINFNEIANLTPKWVQGYSDTTSILFILTTMCNIATIYSENFSGLGMDIIDTSITNNFKILNGENIVQNSYEFYEENSIEDTKLNLDTKVCVKSLYNKNVNVSGRLIGGCLDVLLTLIGTKFDNVDKFLEEYKNDGFIWYLESYNIDTAGMIISLLHLKEAGWFKYIKGIVFGRPYILNQVYNISYKEALHDALNDFNIPVIYDADIGHKSPQFTLINGSYTTIDYTDNKLSITQQLV